MYQAITIFQKSSVFLELEPNLSNSEIVTGMSFNYFEAVSKGIKNSTFNF